jgi:Fe2+ or Zn2+ uptake regulation protein
MVSTRKKQAAHHTQTTSRTLAEVRAALRAAGCRFTAQRAAVYTYLERAHHHPTADDVYRGLRRRLPNLSLATVYKALEALVASQLANKLTNAGGSARYDCGGQQHYHLLDVETGEVFDLPIHFDPQLLKKLNPRLETQLARRGFRVTGHRLEVLGRFRGEGRGARDAK